MTVGWPLHPERISPTMFDTDTAEFYVYGSSLDDLRREAQQWLDELGGTWHYTLMINQRPCGDLGKYGAGVTAYRITSMGEG